MNEGSAQKSSVENVLERSMEDESVDHVEKSARLVGRRHVPSTAHCNLHVRYTHAALCTLDDYVIATICDECKCSQQIIE